MSLFNFSTPAIKSLTMERSKYNHSAEKPNPASDGFTRKVYSSEVDFVAACIRFVVQLMKNRQSVAELWKQSPNWVEDFHNLSCQSSFPGGSNTGTEDGAGWKGGGDTAADASGMAASSGIN